MKHHTRNDVEGSGGTAPFVLLPA